MRKIIELTRHQFEEIFWRLQDYMMGVPYEECNLSAISFIKTNIPLGDLEEHQYSYMLVHKVMGLDVGRCIILNKDKTRVMYEGVMSYIDVQYMRYHDENPTYRMITSDEFNYYLKHYIEINLKNKELYGR